VHASGVSFVNAKQTEFLHIPAASATTLINLSKPDLYTKDQSKQTDKLLVLVLSKGGVPFKKSSIETVCIQCSDKELVAPLPDAAANDANANVTTTTSSAPLEPAPSSTVYFPAISAALGTPITSPATTTFVSSSGLPFVQCYNKTTDGFLYPMKEGLFFFKPPLFVPRSELVSVGCGRGGGSGGTRFVDMVSFVPPSPSPLRALLPLSASTSQPLPPLPFPSTDTLLSLFSRSSSSTVTRSWSSPISTGKRTLL
jgi:hypothetical protein